MSSRLQALRRLLREELPGPGAQAAMAPSERPIPSVEAARASGSREGAALALLYPLRRRWHVVLTERSAELTHHPGQISLPGGRVDEGEDLVRAALREAEEELAVPPDRVEILGPLSPLWIPPSNFLVQPVLGAAAARPAFRPQPAEVARVIEVPLDDLLDPALRREEIWEIRGRARRVPFFELQGHRVWGATAMILVELATLWDRARDE